MRRWVLAAVVITACANGGSGADDDDGSRGTTVASGGPTASSGSISSAASGGAGGTSSGAGGMGTSAGGMTASSSTSNASSNSASSSSVASSTSGGGGSTDACGFPLNEIWFEIDYASASTATNPAWTFSPTTGWGAGDWAPQGESWPEVWDVYNNIPVSNDPIGKLAVVGSSSILQIMIGLGGLISYTKATVCVEGRSVSATASVQFDVYNPLNNCGATASMAHSWQVHTAAIDLGTCLIAGNDFQAVRVEPWGGSATVGVMRLTVALQGAVY